MSAADKQLAEIKARVFAEIEQGTFNFEELKDLPVILHTEIAIKLIEAGASTSLVDNIDKFSGLKLNKDLALKFLAESYLGSLGLSRILDRFSGLDEEIALALIKRGHGYEVAQNIDKFSGLKLNKDLALKFLEDPNLGALGLSLILDRFDGLDEEIAVGLLKSGRGDKVAEYIDKFSGLKLNKNLALKFLEDPNFGSLGLSIILDRFEGLDEEIALGLIKTGRGDRVAEHIDKFSGLKLNKELALKFLEDPFQGSLALARLLDRFSGLDAEIAQKLIERKWAEYVVAKLERFQGLDSKIALSLIELGYYYYDRVVGNIERFGKITDDSLKLAREFGADKKEFEILKKHKSDFEGLTPEDRLNMAEYLFSENWDRSTNSNFTYLERTIGKKSVFKFKNKHWGETTHDLLLFVDSLINKNVFSPEILSMIISEAPNPHELAQVMNQFSPEIFYKIQQSKKERSLPYIENYNFSSYEEFKLQVELTAFGEILPPDLDPDLAGKITQIMKAPGVNLTAIKNDIENGLIISQAENKDGLDEKALIQPIREEFELTPLNEIIKNALLSRELTKVIPLAGQFLKNEKIFSLFADMSIFEILEWQDKLAKEEIMAEYDMRLQAILANDSISSQEKDKAKIRLNNEKKETIKKSALLREGGKFINLENLNMDRLYLELDSPLRKHLLNLLNKKEYQKIREFLEKNGMGIDDNSENSPVFYALKKLIDLGINGPQQAGQAKKLFSELEHFIKDKYQGKIAIQQYLSEEIPRDDQKVVRELLKKYNYEIIGKKVIVQIHKKSNPRGWVAGDYTDCCMRYGTSKNYDYMKRPDTSYFSVSVADEYGEEDMIAQSVLVAAKEKQDKTGNEEYLSKKKDFPVLAIDNIEIANRGIKYRPAIAKAYKDFFPKHYPDKLIILGTSFNDDGGLITGELGTRNMSFREIQGKLEWSDCFGHSNCYIFSDPENDPDRDGLLLLGLATYNFGESPLHKKLSLEESSVTGSILQKIAAGEDDGDGGLNFPDNHSNVFMEKTGGKKEVLGYILAADYLVEEDEKDEVTVEALKFFEGVEPAKQLQALSEYLAMKKNIEVPIVFITGKLSPEIIEFLRSKEVHDIGFKVKETQGKIILKAK